MKRLLCALLLGVGLTQAQTPSPLTFYVHDTSGATPDTPLNSSYAFANTPQGSSTPLVIKAVNTSASTIYWVQAFVSNAAAIQPSETATSPLPDKSSTKYSRRLVHFSLPSIFRPPPPGP